METFNVQQYQVHMPSSERDVYWFRNAALWAEINLILFDIYIKKTTLHSLFISGKLLYMFRVVSPAIIRSTQMYLHYLVFVKPLLLPVAVVEVFWNWFECGVGIVLICFGAVASATAPKPHHTQASSNTTTIAAGSSNGLTNTR